MTKLAVVQMSMTADREQNVAKATQMVRQAAAQGAQIVLLPELFESLYFCQVERERFFALAHPVEHHPFLPHFQQLARELEVVLPISFFEKAGQAYYNSLALIDASGEVLGIYRKSHIPDGPGYEEKYYFNPGDTGFKAFPTRFGYVGAGICWDQWFPECARSMALLGAEILLYPTAIGSEPAEAGGVDTKDMWQRAMIGHAVANLCYLAAANRVGTEVVEGHTQTYYGSSFIADYMGNKLAEAGRSEETILLAELNLEEARAFRAGFGFFRDRRPDLYGPLLTLDGKTRPPRS
ncbi:N-carbamoylputrescine amidase [Meiothermus taiwanensis]|jgi:N-carbamoylputrescine amidase|uniref:N-carbamoyl-D-amino acid hydrolase n=2 Tax=Meiothermus taiwanensis TaxID=172827 RepID=A0A399E0B5_9DEIN|nr:N-carbamoylputrescine amidase [Meiothermus taiwanensis]AWR85304.1 N-carbamoylputrescine amidase [Meiothermus taiwanensis WR-220]KIQ55777.1 N-carbamoylputrescine amidase [Meiothermus taiwanensis]KZK15379.1 N-carbamoylputrescine amidase [Meiothermus taiwanensis]RIH77526.1 N-carbamoyl-D-amino acid hydrolase [Meiothermus taiwanensis]